MVVRGLAIILGALAACLSGCRPTTLAPLPAQSYADLPVIFRPRWNPAGDQLGYLHLDQGGRGLTLVDQGGQRRQLPAPEGRLFRFLTWGPDSQSLTVGFETESLPNQQLGIVSLSDGSWRALTSDSSVFHELGSYSRDGRVAALSSNAGHPERYDVDLFEVASGARRLVYRGESRCIGVRFWGSHRLLVSEDTSLTGNRLVLVDLDTGEKTILGDRRQDCRWLEPVPSEEGLLLITDQGREQPYLTLMTLPSGELVPLPQFKSPVLDFALERKHKLLAALLEDQDGQRLVVGKAGGGSPTYELDLRGGYARHLRFLDGKRLSYLYSRWDCPPSVMIWELEQKEPETFLAGEFGQLSPQRMTRPERLEFPSGDARISAWLYSPGQPTGNVLIWLEHGPGQRASRGFQPQVQFWVDRGWSVLLPDFRGSSGYGRAFEHADDGPRRGAAVADVIAAGAAMRQRGLTRVHLLGQGYGGYLATSALLEAPRSFAGGVVVDPYFDLAVLTRQCRPWQRKAWREELGDTQPFDLRPQLNQLSRPLLVLRTEEDPVLDAEPTLPSVYVKDRAELLDRAWNALEAKD